MKRILVMNGPNLNLLGVREPGTYGRLSLAQINARLEREADRLGVRLTFCTTNSEGELVQALQDATGQCDGVILNAGGDTHTSVALADAITGTGLPVIEVHISNVHARESFRHQTYLAPVCAGTICGLGWPGYLLALQALCENITL